MRAVILGALTAAPALAGLSSATRPTHDRSAAHIPQPWCVSTTDLESKLLRQKLARLASDTSEEGNDVRQALGGLPLTDTTAVVLEGSETVCQRASAALDSSYFSTPQAAAVYVIHIGTYKAVVPANVRSGEFSIAVVMDPAYNKLGVGAL